MGVFDGWEVFDDGFEFFVVEYIVFVSGYVGVVDVL